MRRGDIVCLQGIEGIAISNFEAITAKRNESGEVVCTKVSMFLGYDLNASENCRYNSNPELTVRRAERMLGRRLAPGTSGSEFVYGCCTGLYGVIPLGSVQLWMEDFVNFLGAWYFN